VKPYRLITTHDPTQTWAEGEMRYYETLLEAANAFVKTPDPYKIINWDDGHQARDLTPREDQLVRNVAQKLGYEIVVEDYDDAA
jgi:hypothetical protein